MHNVCQGCFLKLILTASPYRANGSLTGGRTIFPLSSPGIIRVLFQALRLLQGWHCRQCSRGRQWMSRRQRWRLMTPTLNLPTSYRGWHNSPSAVRKTQRKCHAK